jgi:hypothetical protein
MLEKCLYLTDIDDKTKLYENLIETYPRANAPKQICLQFSTGNKIFIDLWANVPDQNRIVPEEYEIIGF